MWGWIKSAAKAVVGVLGQAAALVNEVFNRVASAMDFVLTMLGIMLPRKLRLLVIILRDENRRAVLGQGWTDDVIPSPVPYISAVDEAHGMIHRAMEVFFLEMNVTIVPAVGSEIAIVHGPPAPAYALDPHCDGGAWYEDLAAAGWYYRGLSAGAFAGLPISYYMPVTAFVVRDVVGGFQGCSLGALTDYVTVDTEGARYPTATVLAHELGHACGLFHRDNPVNLMDSDAARGTSLTQWQKAVIRSSRHVSYF